MGKGLAGAVRIHFSEFWGDSQLSLTAPLPGGDPQLNPSWIWRRFPAEAAGQPGLGGSCPCSSFRLHKSWWSLLLLWEGAHLCVNSCGFSSPSELRRFLCAWTILQNLTDWFLLFLRGRVHTRGSMRREKNTWLQKPNNVERKEWCCLWLPTLLTCQ